MNLAKFSLKWWWPVFWWSSLLGLAFLFSSSKSVTIIQAQENLIPRSPIVAKMVEEIKESDLFSYTGYLSGKFPIILNGQSIKLETRNELSSDSILKATQYVYEFMQAQGLATSYHNWNGIDEEGNNLAGRNVVGEITGTVRSNEIVLIVAHLDSMPEGNLSPGADDNASGSVGVMLAAAKLAGHKFERTIRLILFTGEEYGQLGSAAYAKASKEKNENIVAVYNMDMIANDKINSEYNGIVFLETRYVTNTESAKDLALANVFTQVVKLYQIPLVPQIDANSDPEVDSRTFWDIGYPSITAMEYFNEAENEFYHTVDDTMANLNFPFFTSFVKASVGTVAHLAVPVATEASTHYLYLPAILKANGFSATALPLLPNSKGQHGEPQVALLP